MKKYIFISFFNSYPITSGASAVTTSLFENFPAKNKYLIQMSHEKFVKKKNIFNIKISNNFKIFKVIKILNILSILKRIVRASDKKIFIFEGASWVGYSLLTFTLFKIFYKKATFVYHSHNVDLEFNRGFLFHKINFLIEKIIFNKFDITTAVSEKDKKIIKKEYNVYSVIIENALEFNKKFIKKFKYENFIFFSGSIEFLENKISFEKLLYDLLPKVQNIQKNLKIVLTGSNLFKNKENRNIKNLGRISYEKYLINLKKSFLAIYWMRKGPGTKIKIIESLGYNKIVFANKFAISGLKLKNKKLILFSTTEELISKIKKVIKNYNVYQNRFDKIGLYVRDNYDAKKISLKFFNLIEKKLN